MKHPQQLEIKSSPVKKATLSIEIDKDLLDNAKVIIIPSVFSASTEIVKDVDEIVIDKKSSSPKRFFIKNQPAVSPKTEDVIEMEDKSSEDVSENILIVKSPFFLFSYL